MMYWNRWFAIYSGNGFETGDDFRLQVSFVRRASIQIGERRYKHNLDCFLSLPGRLYQRVALRPDIPGSAAAWTGREFAFVGVQWWRFRLRWHWSWGP